jgi:hypothetical protein
MRQPERCIGVNKRVRNRWLLIDRTTSRSVDRPMESKPARAGCGARAAQAARLRLLADKNYSAGC